MRYIIDLEEENLEEIYVEVPNICKYRIVPKTVDDLIKDKIHEVYRQDGFPYEVVTVQDLKEAMK